MRNEHKRMTQDTSDVDNILLYQIILLHEAYHKLEPQLHHLKQITTLGNDLSGRLQAYFTSKETDIVSLFNYMLVSSLYFLCCYSVTIFSRSPLCYICVHIHHYLSPFNSSINKSLIYIVELFLVVVTCMYKQSYIAVYLKVVFACLFYLSTL